MSLLLAISVAPLPEWLTKKGLSNNLSLTITLLLLLASGLLIGVMLANSLSGLSASLPVYEQKLTEYYNSLVQFAQAHHVNISELGKKGNVAPEKMVGFAEGIAGSVTNIISTSIVVDRKSVV